MRKLYAKLRLGKTRRFCFVWEDNSMAERKQKNESFIDAHAKHIRIFYYPYMTIWRYQI